MLLLLLTLFAHAEPAAAPGRSVTLTVTQTHPYCGGAYPSPEVIERSQRAVPVAGQTYLFRKGDTNSPRATTVEVETDATGTARTTLAPGTWCLVSEAKRTLEPSPPQNSFGPYDQTCLTKVQRTCDQIVQVEAGAEAQAVTLALHAPCFWDPGACYTGPPIPPPP